MENEDQYISDFAQRLTKLRLLKGKSAMDMSLSLGQSKNFINNIENMKNYPTMLNFFYICEYLGISPRDYFDYTDSDPYQSMEFINGFKQMNNASKEYILKLIEDINKRP